MTIVKILGGLGNQMFQYALYRSLKSKRENVKADISEFKDYELHNGYELKRVFDIDIDESDKKFNKKFSDNRRTFLTRVRRKLMGYKKSYIREEHLTFSNLINLRNAYLEGYWQSETFFKSVEELIKEDFTFVNELNDNNKELAEKIKNTNSISIHIRRGDYISNPKVYEAYGKVCSIDYFKKAISYILEKVDNPNFFVFSNDIDWVKSNLEFKDPVTYVDWNGGDQSYIDMQLISLCKHNIISNSSFSWWGAWLNRNENKLVLTPNRWKDIKDFNNDRIPASWIQIDV